MLQLFMQRVKKPISEKRISDYIKKGYADKHGLEYKPWLDVRSFSSKGRVSRIFGWKTQRIHHLLSSLEKFYFLLLEWEDSIIDIREQYPLIDMELSLSISKYVGIKNLYYTGSNLPRIFTTDFMVTKIDENGKKKDFARTLKYAAELERDIIIEKFEIERRYWKEKDINWKIVTENEVSKIKARNIGWLHSHKSLDIFMDYEGNIDALPAALIDALAKYSGEPIKDILNRFDSRKKLKEGTALKLLRHLLANKVIKADMDKKIDLALTTKEFILTE